MRNLEDILKNTMGNCFMDTDSQYIKFQLLSYRSSDLKPTKITCQEACCQESSYEAHIKEVNRQEGSQATDPGQDVAHHKE